MQKFVNRVDHENVYIKKHDSLQISFDAFEKGASKFGGTPALEKSTVFLEGGEERGHSANLSLSNLFV